jgi:hypothetical protein
VSGEHGQKFSDEFPESDRQVCVGDGLNGPVAATDYESGLLSEGSPGVNIPAAGARKRTTQLRHGAAAQQRVDSAEQPHREDQPAIAQVSGDFTWCAEDASADRVSHSNSQTKAHAEYAQQVAAGTACASLQEATRGTLGITRRSRLLQESVSGGHRCQRIAREVGKRASPLSTTSGKG